MNAVSTWEVICWVSAVIIPALAAAVWLAWKMGNDPDRPDDYGAPHA